ncbi:unnamed protein product [Leuciscus chuanchicus]
MRPIQKTRDSAKNIRQEFREGNLLFKTTSDSSYASATLERVAERSPEHQTSLKLASLRLAPRLPAIYPHILGCLALRVTFFSPGADESSLHAPLPKEFIRANGINSKIAGRAQQNEEGRSACRIHPSGRRQQTTFIQLGNGTLTSQLKS